MKEKKKKKKPIVYGRGTGVLIYTLVKSKIISDQV